MSDFDWDEFAGDRWQAAEVGDQIVGRVTALRSEVGRDSKKVPIITLQVDKEGTTREVWAGATDLKQQLAHIAPQVGWWLDITFSGERHTGQASPMKLFEVKCKEPTGDTPAPTPIPEPADTTYDPDTAPF